MERGCDGESLWKVGIVGFAVLIHRTIHRWISFSRDVDRRVESARAAGLFGPWRRQSAMGKSCA
jgi:uncharacterized membrane protein YecN with MAPEG domain